MAWDGKESENKCCIDTIVYNDLWVIIFQLLLQLPGGMSWYDNAGVLGFCHPGLNLNFFSETMGMQYMISYLNLFTLRSDFCRQSADLTLFNSKTSINTYFMSRSASPTRISMIEPTIFYPTQCHSIAIDRLRKMLQLNSPLDRMCQDYVYIKWEYRSTMQKINPF